MPKEKDALSYLERVKAKFGDRPAVYGQFLQIMKDFKAQTCATLASFLLLLRFLVVSVSAMLR